MTCPRAAQRLDFVTFHYKGFLEDGKKFDQTYGRDPIRIQLGVGMAMAGLDKGLKGEEKIRRFLTKVYQWLEKRRGF